MRLIKFRVWDTKIKAYISGRFALDERGQYLDCNWSESRHNYVYSYPFQEVERDHILQQFTGLLDENDREIYEGDILLYSVSGEPITVIYLNGGFKCSGGCDFFSYVENGVTVIGNIFENPELIK